MDSGEERVKHKDHIRGIEPNPIERGKKYKNGKQKLFILEEKWTETEDHVRVFGKLFSSMCKWHSMNAYRDLDDCLKGYMSTGKSWYMPKYNPEYRVVDKKNKVILIDDAGLKAFKVGFTANKWTIESYVKNEYKED